MAVTRGGRKRQVEKKEEEKEEEETTALEAQAQGDDGEDSGTEESESESGRELEEEDEEEEENFVGISQVVGDAEAEAKGKRKRKKEDGAFLSKREKLASKQLEDELFGRPALDDDGDSEGVSAGETDEESEDAEADGGLGLSFVIEDGKDVLEGKQKAEAGGEGGKSRRGRAAVARAPAWVDEDEEDLAVSIAGVSRRRKLRKDTEEAEIDGQEFSERLREKYKQLNAKTGWAALSTRKATAEGSESESEDDDEGGEGGRAKKSSKFSKDKLLRKTGSLLAESSVLPPQIIQATRVKDGNYAETSSCVVQAVEFHPKSLLMLTAGFDKMLRLYDIDGVHNPKVRSAFFEGMPIRKATFLNDYSILCAGRRPFCYKFNIETGSIEKIGSHVTGFDKGSSLENFAVSRELGCVSFLGRHGNIALVSSKSNQKIAEMKVDHRATCASFVADSRQFVAATSNGEVSRWDLRTYRCIERYFDQGNLNATALAVSSRGTCAIGSDSGVVNIYQNSNTNGGEDLGTGTTARKTPTRSIMNLTTKIDFLKFNASGNILAMSSSLKRDSLRLVHVPTQTVFSNWPTSKTPLHYVHCSAFSPGSGYFAIGNARGKVLLYRLQHFDSK